MKRIKLRFPTIDENYEASKVYDEALEIAKEAGLQTKNQIASHLRRLEIFTLDMQKELDDIEGGDLFKYPGLPSFDSPEDEAKFIERSLIEVIKGERVYTSKELLRPLERKTYIDRYRELIEIRSKYMQHSCEVFAEKAKLEHLIAKCSYNADTGYRIWKDPKSLKDSKNYILYIAISSKFTDFISGLNQSVLRKLARHPLWRTKWLSATKIGSPIFNGNVSEWDTNKSYLCYWSNFLDNIMSSAEPPEPHIVEDDRLLDAWLETKNREAKKGSRTNDKDDVTRAIFKPKVNPVRKRK